MGWRAHARLVVVVLKFGRGRCRPAPIAQVISVGTPPLWGKWTKGRFHAR